MSNEPRFAHAFNPITRAYIGPVRLQPSPDGAWYLPDHTVDVAPKRTAGEFQALRLSEDGKRWDVVADYRNRMLWDTRTAMPVPNRLALGDKLPKGVTLAEPFRLDGTTPQCNSWDDGKGQWVLQPDYTGRPLWNKADGVRRAGAAWPVAAAIGHRPRAPVQPQRASHLRGYVRNLGRRSAHCTGGCAAG